jgi:hypothetical protein
VVEVLGLRHTPNKLLRPGGHAHNGFVRPSVFSRESLLLSWVFGHHDARR